MKLSTKRLTMAVLPALILASVPSPAAPVTDLYKSKCVMCHGPDGSGNTVMGKKLGTQDLRSAAVQGQPDAQLTAALENGKGKMPGQKGRMSKDEIRQMIGYIRDLAKKR